MLEVAEVNQESKHSNDAWSFENEGNMVVMRSLTSRLPVRNGSRQIWRHSLNVVHYILTASAKT
jgi:hypothetical protein